MHNDIEGGGKCGELRCRAPLADLIGYAATEARDGRHERMHFLIMPFRQKEIVMKECPGCKDKT